MSLQEFFNNLGLDLQIIVVVARVAMRETLLENEQNYLEGIWLKNTRYCISLKVFLWLV